MQNSPNGHPVFIPFESCGSIFIGGGCKQRAKCAVFWRSVVLVQSSQTEKSIKLVQYGTFKSKGLNRELIETFAVQFTVLLGLYAYFYFCSYNWLILPGRRRCDMGITCFYKTTLSQCL